MRKMLIVLAATLLVAGCGKEAEKPKVQAPETRAETLHRKARAARMGDLVGYDGKQIQKNLDKVIDANEAHVKELEKARQDLQ